MDHLRQLLAAGGTMPVFADQVEAALRDVVDPELGVNVVDLGLVYGIEFPDPRRLRLRMTMTTPACPLSDYLEQQLRRALHREVPDLEAVEIEWVFDPPWTPERRSPAARRELGWMGR